MSKTNAAVTGPQLTSFFEDCLSWYGPGGTTDMGASYTQIVEATIRYLREPDHLERFEGDTIDRGCVREFLQDMFGLTEVSRGESV